MNWNEYADMIAKSAVKDINKMDEYLYIPCDPAADEAVEDAGDAAFWAAVVRFGVDIDPTLSDDDAYLAVWDAAYENDPAAKAVLAAVEAAETAERRRQAAAWRHFVAALNRRLGSLYPGRNLPAEEWNRRIYAAANGMT